MVKQTILSMLLLFAAIVAHAQGGQVNGQVKDAMGESVIGATVAEAGTPKNATVTDYDGHFVLKLFCVVMLCLITVNFCSVVSPFDI